MKLPLELDVLHIGCRRPGERPQQHGGAQPDPHGGRLSLHGPVSGRQVAVDDLPHALHASARVDVP